MVGRLLRRLFTSGNASAPAAVTPTRSAPSHAQTDEESVGGPMPRRPLDVAELAGNLELEARNSVEALAEACVPEGRQSDVQHLLESFRESMSGMVRQPPLAAQRALSLTRNPNTNVAELIRLVEQDPTLGQSLLRYANSAYYATTGGACVSLQSAVRRVGLSGVHNVVLKCMMEGLMIRTGGAYQDLVEKTWSHMVRTAPIARALSPVFDVQPDEAYALGLLHDAGKLVIFDRISTLRASLRRDLILPYTALAAVLRMLHEDFGALAAIQWGLSATAVHAIATHHRSPVPDIPAPGSELLFVAERLDLATLGGRAFDLDQWWRDGQLSVLRARADGLMASPPPELPLPKPSEVGDAISALELGVAGA